MDRLASIENRIWVIKHKLASLFPAADSTNESRRSFRAMLAQAQRAPQPSPACYSTGQYDGIIATAAAEYGLDADLIHAVIRAESDYNPWCRATAGAEGLMQLMPQTAAGLGVTNPYDPEQNIRGGSRYLAIQVRQFGDLELALAAYNAGPGAVRQYGGVPPYNETQQYVGRVL